MTRKEFEDYIDSFNKKPGEFTNDDIYHIGLKHKELCSIDKNWADLAKRVGWKHSVEWLRCYVKKRQKEEGILPKAKITDTILENITQSDLINEKQEMIKERSRVREEWTTYRKLLKDEAKIETFKEELLKAISNLDSLPKLNSNVVKSSNNKNTKEAILMLSDLHIGVDCNNFYNTFNPGVAAERLTKLLNDTVDYCKLNNVSLLNVCNLGDLISGYIHVTNRIQNTLNITEQITMAADLLSQLLSILSLNVEKVVYRSCTDNHSRAFANIKENIEAENFTKIIDLIVELRLKDYPNIVFPHDNIDDSIGSFKLRDSGKKVLFAHGHLESPDKVIDNFVGATGEFVDYVLLSHFHATRMKAYNGATLYINGSIVGTEEFALSKRLFNKPSQTLLIFDDINVLNISINL